MNAKCPTLTAKEISSFVALVTGTQSSMLNNIIKMDKLSAEAILSHAGCDHQSWRAVADPVGWVDRKNPTVIFDFIPICADCIQVLPAVILSK
jgi:hypothetical protein